MNEKNTVECKPLGAPIAAISTPARENGSCSDAPGMCSHRVSLPPVLDDGKIRKALEVLERTKRLAVGEPLALANQARRALVESGTVSTEVSPAAPSAPVVVVPGPPSPEPPIPAPLEIKLTEEDIDDIDVEIAKDARESKRCIFRDVIISKRNGLGLPHLSKEEEDAEIEKLEEQYRKKSLEEDQDELPEIEDITHFLSKPMDKPKILIEGVLEKGSKMSMAGCSKGYKTWLMLDQAISLACGVTWLGLKTTKSKVLYLNLEMKETSVKPRIEAIVKAKGVELQEGSLFIWNLRGKAASFEKIIPKIIDTLKNTQFDAILLDPIYKIYGDIDENKAGDVALLMNELERLAEKSGAAIILSEHYSKGNQANKESIDRASGSGVFARDPDAILTFTKHEVEDAFVVESTLRDFKRLEPFVVKWQYPLVARDSQLNPKKLKTGISKGPVYTVDELIKVVAVERKTKAELKQAVIAATNMGETTFKKLFKEFEGVEGVSLDAKTKKYSYTNPDGAKLT